MPLAWCAMGMLSLSSSDATHPTPTLTKRAGVLSSVQPNVCTILREWDMLEGLQSIAHDNKMACMPDYLQPRHLRA